MLISAIAAGKWPWRAPTKNNLELANIAPFNAPNVEQATKKGIIQDITPSIWSPKVWKYDIDYKINIPKMGASLELTTATALEESISLLVNTTK